MMSNMKQKLKFIVQDTTVEYEGKAKNRERDLMKYLMQKDVTDTVVIDTYRYNFPEIEENMSDTDILDKYYLAIKKSNEKKNTDRITNKELSQQLNQVSEEPKENKTIKMKSSIENKIKEAKELLIFSGESETIENQHKDQSENSKTDQKELNQFIKSVVNTKRVSIADKVETELNSGINKAQLIKSKKVKDVPKDNQTLLSAPAKIPTYPSLNKDPSISFNLNRFEHSDKTEENPNVLNSPQKNITVQLTMEGSNTYKLIFISSHITYKELMAQVKSKYGISSSVYYMDSADRIEIDDTDSLHFYIQSAIKRGLPPRFVCSPQCSSPPAFCAVTPRPQHKMRDGGVVFRGHTGAVYGCACGPGQSFVSCGRDKTVRLWGVETSHCAIIGGHSDISLSCDMAPSGKYIASSSIDPAVRIWKVKSGTLHQSLTGHHNKVFGTRFDTAGTHLATASCDRTVRIWSLSAGKSVSKLEGHASMVFSCDFGSTDSRHVVSGGEDRAVRLWDWGTRTQVQALSQHSEAVWGVRYSQDDKYIASCGSDRRVIVWDVAMMRPLKIFTGHTSPVHDAIFSTDGRYIYSCGRDSRILRWPVHTSTDESPINSSYIEEEYIGHTDTVYHLDLSKPINQHLHLISSSKDGTVRLWDIAATL